MQKKKLSQIIELPAIMSLELPLGRAVSFEPAGIVTQIFFDDLNQQVRKKILLFLYKLLLTFFSVFFLQIFSVRSGGATGIICKGFRVSECSTCRVQDLGQIITIKFSPSRKILSIQRKHREVEFWSFSQLGNNGQLDSKSYYKQACRAKQATLLG